MKASRIISINTLVRVAAGAAGQLFAFILAERIGERAGVGAILVGLIAVGYFATELIAAPVMGRIADRRGYARVLRWGTALGITAMIIGAASATSRLGLPALAATLLAARVIEGASAACAAPTTLALLAQTSAANPTRRLRVMGLFEVTSLIGLSGGFALASIAWTALGGYAFALLPLPYAAAALLTFSRGVRGVSGGTSLPSWRGVVRMIFKRASVSFAAAWLAVNAVVGVWFQQAPYLLKLPARSTSQVLVGGYSAATIGAIFVTWGLIFLTGIALWSIVAPRWPRRVILALALGGMLAVVLSLAFVNHGAPKSLLIVGALGILIESGFAPAAFAHLADITDAKNDSRGAIMGFYAFLLAAGQLAGATLGAPFTARWQMDGVLVATAILAISALVGVALMPDTRRAKLCR